MSKPFIDSNIVLYLLSGDAAKADRAQALVEAGGVISVQVLNEVASVCLRKLKMPWEEVDALLLAVKAACDVLPLTVASHEKAVEVAKRFKLSFYDAHIVASALMSGAEVLLSEVMQSGMLIDGLLIQNPFKEAHQEAEMSNVPINLVSATQTGTYRIRLVFEDNHVQEVDFQPFLVHSHHPDIRAYLEPARFSGFRLAYGELVWGDYELCFPVMDLYRNTIEHNNMLSEAA